MSETPLPEPLEDFLQAPPSLPPQASMQESLLRQTSILLRKPRGWRRWPIVAGIAASIILALVSAYFAWRPGNAVDVSNKDLVERKNQPPVVEEKPKPEPPPQEPQLPAVVVKVGPLDLEWTAFDVADDRKRASLYFQAGDLYLDEHHDYESATRCYTQALTYCGERELEFNPNDNWLVMALKRDHRKEN